MEFGRNLEKATLETIEAGEMTIIVMPGPPRELHAMWPHALETGPVQRVLERTPPYRLVAGSVRSKRIYAPIDDLLARDAGILPTERTA